MAANVLQLFGKQREDGLAQGLLPAILGPDSPPAPWAEADKVILRHIQETRCLFSLPCVFQIFYECDFLLSPESARVLGHVWVRRLLRP